MEIFECIKKLYLKFENFLFILCFNDYKECKDLEMHFKFLAQNYFNSIFCRFSRFSYFAD